MAYNLEIGSGTNPQPGYVHLERYLQRNSRAGDVCACDVIGCGMALPFLGGVFDSVLMFGVFEHFGIHEIQEVMLEVARVLRPGGVFKFDVPDFDWFCEGYLHPDKRPPGREEGWYLGAIFGGQDGIGQFHKWGWNQKRLEEFLSKPNWRFSGFKLVGRQWRDAEENHLIYECVKQKKGE